MIRLSFGRVIIINGMWNIMGCTCVLRLQKMMVSQKFCTHLMHSSRGASDSLLQHFIWFISISFSTFLQFRGHLRCTSKRHVSLTYKTYIELLFQQWRNLSNSRLEIKVFSIDTSRPWRQRRVHWPLCLIEFSLKLKRLLCSFVPFFDSPQNVVHLCLQVVGLSHHVSCLQGATRIQQMWSKRVMK